MKELSYFEQQYNTAAAAKDKLQFQMSVSAGLTVIFGILTLTVPSRPAMGILQLIFTLLFLLLCRRELVGGLRSFLKLRPSAESFFALALFAETMRGVRLIVSDAEDPHIFAVVLYLSVTLSLLLKWFFTQQILRNLDLIRDQKTYALQVSDLSLSKQYINRVCAVNPVTDFPNVVRASMDHDPTEKQNGRFAFFTTLGVVAAAILSSLIRAGSFFTALSSLLILCAGFTAELTPVLPYLFLQSRLRKTGSILMGNHSTTQLKAADTLLIRDTDLFPPERNRILYFQVLPSANRTEAEEYAATLLHLIQSPLEDAFLQFVPGVKQRPQNVLQWRVIKNYGVVATVNADTVLFGNRHLLLSHNIRPWSPEKEAMLTAAGVHITYLTVNGKIAATMIFRYGDNPELKQTVAQSGGEFQLLVETRDCCINETMILRRYELPRTKIAVPDAEELESLHEMRSDLEEDSRTPALLSTQNTLGLIEPIRLVKKLERTVEICRLTQQLSTLFGLALTLSALLIFPGSMHWGWLLAFQCLWSLPTVAVTLFTHTQTRL